MRTQSVEETLDLGRAFAKRLNSGDCVCFFGDLGAGKTTFIKGVVAGLGGEGVNSPTFVYLNIYEGQVPIYHFDLYRLRDEEQFLEMGFDEFLFGGGICLIEWSERIAGSLPPNCLQVTLSHLGKSEREVAIHEKVSV